MSDDRRGKLVRATDTPDPWQFEHPLGDNSEVHVNCLSQVCGMERLGVHRVRVPPGKDSFPYHTHHVEEECFFIISGRGIAEVDGEEHEVGPGDFLGFGTPSVGHQLRNPFDEELVYLAVGERKSVEVAEFPKLGKVIVRRGGVAETVDEGAMEPFWKERGS